MWKNLGKYVNEFLNQKAKNEGTDRTRFSFVAKKWWSKSRTPKKFRENQSDMLMSKFGCSFGFSGANGAFRWID